MVCLTESPPGYVLPPLLLDPPRASLDPGYRYVRDPYQQAQVGLLLGKGGYGAFMATVNLRCFTFSFDLPSDRNPLYPPKQKDVDTIRDLKAVIEDNYAAKHQAAQVFGVTARYEQASPMNL